MSNTDQLLDNNAAYVQAFGDNYLVIRVSMIDDRIFSWHVEVFELQPDGRYRSLRAVM